MITISCQSLSSLHLKQLMRILLSLIILAWAVAAQSQNKAPVNSNPEYYVDSLSVASIRLFDPQKIEKVNVVKEKDAMAPNGKVFITIKKSATLKWISIKDIVSKYKLSDTAACIFMLNDNIITDTAGFRIDEDYIAGIDIMKASAIENLPNNIPNLALLKLFTGSKEDSALQQVVRIRTKKIPSNIPG